MLDEKTEACTVCGYQFLSLDDSDSLLKTTETEAKQLGEAVAGKENPPHEEESLPFEEEDDGLPFDEEERGIPAIGEPQTFVGREDDLGRLEEELKRVLLNKRLSFVTVYGPVGIGKSRLIREFGERALEKHEVVLMKGDAGGSNAVPFRGFKQAISGFFGISLNATTANKAIEQIIEKVGDYLPESKRVETAHLLAQFLGYDMEASPVIEPLLRNPSQMELRMFIAIRRLFNAVASGKGLLLSWTPWTGQNPKP